MITEKENKKADDEKTKKSSVEVSGHVVPQRQGQHNSVRQLL